MDFKEEFKEKEVAPQKTAKGSKLKVKKRGIAKPRESGVKSVMYSAFRPQADEALIHTDRHVDNTSQELGAKAFAQRGSYFAIQAKKNKSICQTNEEEKEEEKKKEEEEPVQAKAGENVQSQEEEKEEKEEKEEPMQAMINETIQGGREDEREESIQSKLSTRSGQIYWGKGLDNADIDYYGSQRGLHTKGHSESGKGPSWSASEVTQSIVAPQPVWGVITRFGDGELLNEAIFAPVQRSLNFVQNVSTFNPRRLGWTFHPIAFKAPDFKFNSYKKTKKLKGWYAKPRFTVRAYEGNSKAFYVGTGLHKTTLTETIKGKKIPVFWKMPKAMASRNYGAELEHSRDHKHAYKISLKEADRVLQRHIVGRKFGPEPTKADVENKVLNTIKNRLTHPQLGNNKTQWGAKYRMLSLKTLIRDNNFWHSFGLGNRKVISKFQGTGPAKVKVPTKVIYTVNKGTTKIGVVKSSKIIKY